MEAQYKEFTAQMKKTYKILAPDMLPVHFKLICRVLRDYGYDIELLKNSGPQIAEEGLKYVHNDSCYPAILVVGQFIDALKSGKYDPDKTALIMFQTGGGCRASNYIFLIRKALERAGFSNVPVISLSLAGLEKHSGFKLTLGMLHKIMYAIIYADLMMQLENKTVPYEVNQGETKRLTEKLTEEIAHIIKTKKASYSRMKKICAWIIDEYAKIPVVKTDKVKVGVVGEIFVKFSPLGNNGLEKFLVGEGAEVVMPGFYNFLLYCVYDNLMDYKLYGKGKALYLPVKIAYKILCHIQKTVIKLVDKDGRYNSDTPFEHIVELAEKYIGIGCKMGEGWLLPAEMLELADSGVCNIVCAQPFGCLPNHIVGKGMMNPIKQKNPNVNIVAIDYDASASEINQQNRIKLMIANAARAKNEDTFDNFAAM